jgi:hypothetical protein
VTGIDIPKAPGGHAGEPAKGSARRVSDGQPADLLRPADYPLTADCTGGDGPIRLERLAQVEWTHVPAAGGPS